MKLEKAPKNTLIFKYLKNQKNNMFSILWIIKYNK